MFGLENFVIGILFAELPILGALFTFAFPGVRISAELKILDPYSTSGVPVREIKFVNKRSSCFETDFHDIQYTQLFLNKFDLIVSKVDKQGTDGTHNIDIEGPSCSNWLRFVNSPARCQQQNVIPITCEGIIFDMTSPDAEPGEELLIWNGNGYGRFLG
ncbi:uncharacterized protein LOC134236097, partial [Saccostrea cucullata]|uniref:uncharacterized protein LOC134236097 n=1 Tax=Saccostrea cuccullata TaxID=36930 RepID=UPI002ED0F528